jgi:hypothetical protein
MTKKITKKILVLFLLLLACAPARGATPPPGAAGEIPEYALSPGEETHLPLRLNAGKSKLIRLGRPAAHVKVEPSTRVGPFLASPVTLALLAHREGAARLTVLDTGKKQVMSRVIIVMKPGQKYVRLRRSDGDARLYYCPDLCYESRLAQNAVSPRP